jgi:hypothetical protein
MYLNNRVMVAAETVGNKYGTCADDVGAFKAYQYFQFSL